MYNGGQLYSTFKKILMGKTQANSNWFKILHHIEVSTNNYLRYGRQDNTVSNLANDYKEFER